MQILSPFELEGNIMRSLGTDWMLITAGSEEKLNTMTASWGGTGILWNKNVSYAFIRESRYTREFVDGNDYFTLSFFGGNMMKELTFCGRNSGRDTDKLAQTGLVPLYDEAAPYFEQADLVLVCKKLYRSKMSKEGFIDPAYADKFYSDNDWHYTYIGEIVKVLKKA